LPEGSTGLKPDETVQKILLSTPCRFIGEFEGKSCLLTHSFSGRDNHSSRNYFIFSFYTEPIEKAPGVAIPDYSYLGGIVCSYLSVLFGKRFDRHGMIEGNGHHWVPNIYSHDKNCQKSLPHNSDEVRGDFGIPLNLAEVSRIDDLFHGRVDDKFRDTFIACCRFYSLALKNSEESPEVAYLNLITACEILSNHFDFTAEDLLDKETLELFSYLEENCEDRSCTVKQIKSQMRSIKRRFVKTLVDLVDTSFFDFSESTHPYGQLKKETFEKAIKAAYDLRSRYIHTCSAFGKWVAFSHGGSNNEVQFGTPALQSKELAKIIKKAPTLVGLERIVRYALLQFASRNGVFSSPWTFYNLFSNQ